MDALEVETSIAAGEQALQALLTCAGEAAGKWEAHAAAKGLFTRLLPMGLAARKWDFAQRGTGDVGPVVTRADGVLLPREQPRRGRDDGSLVGTFAVVRTCDRTPGEPGIFPLDAPVTLPERGDSYVLQEWLTGFAVEHPFQERAGCFAQLFDLEVAESVLRAVAPEAPQDDEDCSAPRSGPPEDKAGELLVGSVDGQGVPMITAEAVKLKAKLGTAEKRPQQKAALVGVSSTVEPKPRTPETLAERLGHPAAARARRQRAHVTDEGPRAQPVRRVASLGRTKQAVLARLKAEAARRDPRHRQPLVIRRDGALGLGRLAPPLFTPWTRVTCVLDIRPVVSSLGAAANARCGEASQAGQHWVQRQLTVMLRGRVGDVIGGLRQLLTKPRRRTSVRETRAKVITCFHNHRRGMPYDMDLAAGVPVGTGVVESACGSVVTHRLEGEGQRWSLEGAEAILTWRALKQSHDHDLRDYWRFRARQMRGRLYGHTPN